MTRKDYQLIANVLRAQRAGYRAPDADLATVILALADALEADNLRFDRNKFLKATYVS